MKSGTARIQAQISVTFRHFVNCRWTCFLNSRIAATVSAQKALRPSQQCH